MKRIIILLMIFIFAGAGLKAQIDRTNQRTGRVIYISSQNVYTAFDNMSGINVDDTLWISENSQLLPVVIVNFLSSTSCAGTPLIKGKLKIKDKVIAFVKTHLEQQPVVAEETKAEHVIPATVPSTATAKSYTGKQTKINGRVGISSYSGFSGTGKSSGSQRWKYLVSLDAQNISGSPFSLNSYVTFSYRTSEWNEVQNNLMNALRVYALSIEYDISDKTRLSFGRKINSKVSNIGAVDGFQFATSFGKFYGGFILGSRPNYSDYSYNFKMFEYGGYIGRSDTLENGIMQNSIAIFQQTNNFKTDRRFLYLQHNSPITKSLYFFVSSEIDLYKRISGTEESTFNLTSMFLSIRYSPSRFFSISTSYDARETVIYYETFKNYADSLLESETRQGFRTRINLRPVTNLMLSFSFGYRFKNNDINPSKNYTGFVTWSRVPIIKSSVQLSYNRLFTNYVDGSISGIRLYKDLFLSNLNAGFGYRRVNYDFTMNSGSLKQDILSLDASLKLAGKIYLSISYEGVFDDIRNFSTLYVSLNKRF